MDPLSNKKVVLIARKSDISGLFIDMLHSLCRDFTVSFNTTSVHSYINRQLDIVFIDSHSFPSETVENIGKIVRNTLGINPYCIIASSELETYSASFPLILFPCDIDLLLQILNYNAKIFDKLAVENDNSNKSVAQLCIPYRTAANYKRLNSIIGTSDAILAVKDKIALYANSNLPIMLLGETGTGKTMIARCIHKYIGNKDSNFFEIDMSTFPESLHDTIIFGCKKGTFTGAENSVGFIERADGGTLFIDEIGNLSLATQQRLLKVLEDGFYYRVGDTKQLHAVIRFIFATNANINEMRCSGMFRNDLWFRMSVIKIDVPPLRERGNDIFEIARSIAHKKGVDISADALAKLSMYDWPGNIRELNSCISRAAILSGNKVIQSCHIDFYN